MKKIILSLGILMTLNTFAQKNTLESSNISAQVFIPTGTLSNTNVVGIGMSVEGETNHKKNVGVALVSGYNYVLGKEGNPSIIQFPAFVGFKYHFGEFLSFGQFFGVNYITQNYGFNPATLTYIKFDGVTFTTDIRYTNSSLKKIISDFSGVAVTLGYKF